MTATATIIVECEKHELIGCTICSGKDRSAMRGVRSPLHWRDGSVSAELLDALDGAGGSALFEDLARRLSWEVGRVRSVLGYLRDEFSAVEFHGHVAALMPGGIDRFARRERNYHPSHLFPSERRCR